MAILCGESGEPFPDECPVVCVPGLSYIDESSPADVPALNASIRSALASVGFQDPDVWHIHNHSLGKSAVFSSWVDYLVNSQQALVLQPHDFAEDGRPLNFERLSRGLGDDIQKLYPLSDRVRYATLQQRDLRILQGAGLPADRGLVLANPIERADELPEARNAKPRCLYLSRCIRRKNVGELLLWASVFGDHFSFATSLIPDNPVELKIFERWRWFASDRGIPVEFGVGLSGQSFMEMICDTDAFITTSVGEGFGMSFLEPAMFARPVIGRNLPEITANFVADGVKFGGLYNRLDVPIDLVPAQFWERAANACSEQLGRLGLLDRGEWNPERVQEVWTRDGSVDFGRLDEDAQRAVIAAGFTPSIDLTLDRASAELASNRDVIEAEYNEQRYGARLHNVYAQLITGAGNDVHYLDGKSVIASFGDPSSWSMLRL